MNLVYSIYNSLLSLITIIFIIFYCKCTFYYPDDMKKIYNIVIKKKINQNISSSNN